MTLIDWSDAEEMLGLLAEYVRDERAAAHGNRVRARFLRELSSSVDSLASQAEQPVEKLLARLRHIVDAQPVEFGDDIALVHVRDCIEELSRLATQRSGQ